MKNNLHYFKISQDNPEAQLDHHYFIIEKDPHIKEYMAHVKNIKEILIISGPEHSGHFLRLLGSGRDFNAKFTYEIQDEPKGIAHALGLAREFANEDSIAVILGDNIFEDNFSKEINDFAIGSAIFLKEVEDAERYGVAEISSNRIISIEEKPAIPKSDYAMTGFYLFDKMVFDIIKTLKPSWRNQFEITDVVEHYLKNNLLTYYIVNGFWTDAGTLDSLYNAITFIKGKNSINDKNIAGSK